MKIHVIGGGPAGLYLSLLMKKADPSHQITVLERNRADDTFGFGVVFSDATLGRLEAADAETYTEIIRRFAHWDNIDIHFKGGVTTSTGHGFAGLSRMTLLSILQNRCREVGVELKYETDVTDLAPYAKADLLVGADGVNSTVREAYKKNFEPEIDWRLNKFVWLGTTKPFSAFTFYFKENEHGLWRVHAYRYEEGQSTFIVEAREETWKAAGLEQASEETTMVYCAKLFAEELGDHTLLKNRSLWRSFPIIRNKSWSHENVVLIGDAVHTAHFSVGSGTKLAMEDAIELAEQLQKHPDIPTALAAYEKDRRPEVESLQRAAQVSLEWFENSERYMNLEPMQFAYSLLTRSLRINHEDLKVRDPELARRATEWFGGEGARPPMLQSFPLRDLTLENRIVVSPMCQYRAVDGLPNDWHLVHLGSRAVGGAGLIITEMTNVSPEARISPGCTGMYALEHVAAWKRIVDFVHAESPAKIGIQLGHAGRKGSTKIAWEGMDEPLEEGWPIVAPSPIPYRSGSTIPREMNRADMDRVRDEFARATVMCDHAGFDLIELHFAHGYLLASFLSPLTNIRKDEYGGSIENRLRYPLEVFDAVRKVWPKDRPISVRLSATDWAEGGGTVEDAVEIAKALKHHGCDIVDVSAGQTVPAQRPVYGRQFQTPFSDRIRQEAGIPTMSVGNISSYGDVNAILLSGRADLCVMARAHLWNPYWTHHAAQALDSRILWAKPYSVLDRYTPRFD